MNLSRWCLGIFRLYSFSSSIVQASLTDGLVLYLPFDEGRGRWRVTSPGMVTMALLKGLNGLRASLEKHSPLMDGDLCRGAL